MAFEVCGMTKLLAGLCDVFCVGKPGPVVAVITKTWQLLLGSFSDEELYSIASDDDDHDSGNDSSQNEIFSASVSGVGEG